MPSLVIVAGPNGSGKSTVSKTLLSPLGIEAFDFDLHFYEVWSRFGFDPYVEPGVRNSIVEKFQDHLESGYKDYHSVAFETNFNNPATLEHIDRAKSMGFEVKLYFIGLESPELAIKRVEMRVENGGHPVDDETVRSRYYDGLKLLNDSYDLFDEVYIFESPPNYAPVLKCIAIDDLGAKLFSTPSFINYLPKLHQSVSKS